VGGLAPGTMLASLLTQVPELRELANVKLAIPFNMDSSRVGPAEWVQLAKILHAARAQFDAFVLVCGTDTMAYIASALSLMLAGFGKPVVLTGSQLPLQLPRSDARQNLVDALTCAVAESAPPHPPFREVAICFGGTLLRGNRAQKVHSTAYRAFDSPTYPPLARLGVDVDWNEGALLRPHGVYTPRFQLEHRVMRVPIVPGGDPHLLYGDVSARAVKAILVEAFGLCNLPDTPEAGFITWIAQQRAAGVRVLLTSQCSAGDLDPSLYRSGAAALGIGAETSGRMTPEAAVAKLMLCLKYPDIPVGAPLAGES
jgi:L-asparaginase/Glu-tRNA(Gln) amidotransferase subunit D